MTSLKNLIAVNIDTPYEHSPSIINAVGAIETLGIFHPDKSESLASRMFSLLDAEYAAGYDEYGSHVWQKEIPDPDYIEIGLTSEGYRAIWVPLDWFIDYVVEPQIKSHELIPSMFLKTLKELKNSP